MAILAGLMSGTSMDAVDGCLADFSTAPPRILATASLPLDDLEPVLRALATGHYPPGSDPIDLLGEMDRALGARFATCINELVARAGISRESLRVAGVHGQTIRHRPGCRRPFTLQIGDPNLTAELTGVPVVCDFRRRDLAAGGEGAPLAPLAHRQLFDLPPNQALFIVNLGGISNLTCLLPGEPVRGFDIGPANTLMDAWTRKVRRQPFDRDGLWAASGRVHERLLATLKEDPWFQTPPPKSTGPEYFNLDWVTACSTRAGLAVESIRAADIQATLMQLTADTIADAIGEQPTDGNPIEVLLVGGGALNPTLVAAIDESVSRRSPGVQVASSMERGVDPRWVECLVFAWLAGERLAGRALDTTGVTGARHPVRLGGLYIP
ncbi:MAG: anhydro-N-acetylmuramic acid kinase [Halothiobacillaceae bacterium]